MATMKDIARLAGVSQGTVSNVINGRGNVSVEKIRKVEQAAKELGYVINAQAKQLRKDSSLSTNVAVILPNVDERINMSFFLGAKQHLEEQGYSVLLFLTSHSPYRERQIVRQAAELRVAGVVTVTCCLNDPDLYGSIQARGGKVVHAIRGVDNAAYYVGFDFATVGRDIGAHLLQSGYESAALMTGPEYYPDNHSLIGGLREVLDDNHVPLRVVQASGANSAIAPFEFFSGEPPEVIVLSNSGYLGYVQLAASVGSIRSCPPIVTVAQDLVTASSPGVFWYGLDFIKAGQRAAEIITGQLEPGDAPDENGRIILPPKGFQNRMRSGASAPVILHPTPLRILMPKGESTRALMRMTPAFTKQTGIQVEYVVKTPQEMWDGTVQAAASGRVDAVRNSMTRLSLFPGHLFSTIPRDVFDEITAGMLPRIIKDYSTIGGKLRAIPFDIGLGTLVYRKDLFQDPVLKRMYYEQSGRSLEVPDSFEEFSNLVRFFDRRQNPQSPVPYGTSINLDSSAELASNLTLRYIHYTDDLQFRKGHTKTDVAALRRCVQDFQELSRHAMPVRKRTWIGSALDQFISGKTAMEIIFVNYASGIINLQNITYGGQVGYAPIPGGVTYITGGSFSIFADSKQPQAANTFIDWACGRRQAELFTLLGGISPHRHVYDSSDIITRYPSYRQLPGLVETACGRELFDTLDSSSLEKRTPPMLRDLLTGALDPESCVKQLASEFTACLL